MVVRLFSFLFMLPFLWGCLRSENHNPPKKEETEKSSTPLVPKDPSSNSFQLLVPKTIQKTPAFHHIQIASFNIQIFGKRVLEDKKQLGVLNRILRQFDLVAIQEVRNKDPEHLRLFLEKFNADQTVSYAGMISPRLGRTQSKEQYLFLWNPQKITYLENTAYVSEDAEDDFEREPFVASFRSGFFDFTLLNIHIKPDEAQYEMTALARLLKDLTTNNKEKDILVLGDFNADGSYFDESSLALEFPGWIQLITNEIDTMVKTDWTYDRIMVSPGVLYEYLPRSARACYWDKEFGEKDREFVAKISDHYPVTAQFHTQLPDDD